MITCKCMEETQDIEDGIKVRLKNIPGFIIFLSNHIYILYKKLKC